MFKSITTFVLSLLLVGSSVHAASYYNINNGEQGMCDVNCDNKKHRSSSHECDRCLNEEIQRLTPEQTNESPPVQSETLLSLVSTNSTPGFLSIELYGRPPPNLL
tara:strand:- start:213 stop:527 length:315 start_codon:yes stop_codon:yes gene_type:complete